MYFDLIQRQLERKGNIQLDSAATGGSLNPEYLIKQIGEVLNVKHVSVKMYLDLEIILKFKNDFIRYFMVLQKSLEKCFSL